MLSVYETNRKKCKNPLQIEPETSDESSHHCCQGMPQSINLVLLPKNSKFANDARGHKGTVETQVVANFTEA